jgi:hypothetical protein
MTVPATLEMPEYGGCGAYADLLPHSAFSVYGVRWRCFGRRGLLAGQGF